MTSNTGAAILNRLIEPENDDLSADAARFLARLDFRSSDHVRMAVLSAKASEGALAPDEQDTGFGPHLPLPFQFIIHAVANYMGDVFDTPDILSRYEVLSMSLMSNLNVHAHDPQGVILRVPENNILAASPTDVAVQNYAPAFSLAAPNAVTITDNLLDVAARTGGLQSPTYLLQHVRNYPYYNEVVVCGRAGVPLPHGVTGPISVVGVYMLTDANGVIRGGDDTRQARELRVRACARNHQLPMLYIPNSMASAVIP